MPDMTAHQQRLWHDMLRAIDLYRADRITLDELVGQLHGAMQAGDFDDDALIKTWHERWGALEEWRATDRAQRVSQPIDREVDAMHRFLLDVQRAWAMTSRG